MYWLSFVFNFEFVKISFEFKLINFKLLKWYLYSKLFDFIKDFKAKYY